MTSDTHRRTLRYWAIVPAAGKGARMGAALPKQYLKINDQTILEHTLTRLSQVPQLAGIYLALSAGDQHWRSLSLRQYPHLNFVEGGSERCDSVLNSLLELQHDAHEDDWVLVHDAARPCIAVESVTSLINQLQGNEVGGILGVPVSDTLKQVDQDFNIQCTVDRRVLWQAQTPQMFRYGLLLRCLQQSLKDGKAITDEASALEACGYQPLIVQGRSDNIKITRPEDLAVATIILQQQSD